MSLLNYESRHTRIKICGLSNELDIHTAMSIGIDAIGLVFYPPSPRCLDMGQGATLSHLHGGALQNVVLVVDADDYLVQNIKDHCKVDIWQFHGNETPERCLEIADDKPWLKAARIDEKFKLDEFCLRLGLGLLNQVRQRKTSPRDHHRPSLHTAETVNAFLIGKVLG